MAFYKDMNQLSMVSLFLSSTFRIGLSWIKDPMFHIKQNFCSPGDKFTRNSMHASSRSSRHFFKYITEWEIFWNSVRTLLEFFWNYFHILRNSFWILQNSFGTLCSLFIPNVFLCKIRPVQILMLVVFVLTALLKFSAVVVKL